MALPAKQLQHPPARGAATVYHHYAWPSRPDAACKIHGSHGTLPSSDEPDYHQYAWPLRADSVCKTYGSRGMLPSPDESSMNSWEARAFAEDQSSLAAGIWPPRAYPCSFCHREFRSAQALGGHMNVHRRDRARMRHSSPPPPPFCTPQNISLQSAANIIHKFQHGYSSSTGDVKYPSAACPDIYPNEILSKANVLPTALPLPATSPKSSTSASLAAMRYPSHMAASFPLRLHLLASEAASTLMLPEAEAMNQLSLWPASALDSGHGCRSSTAINAHIKLGNALADNSSPSVQSSLSTSCSSSLRALKAGTPVTPSMGASPCKRARHVDVPLIQLEDESPRKKCNVTNSSDDPPYNQDMSLKSCSKDDAIIIHGEPGKDESWKKSDNHVTESMRTIQQEWVEACGGGECVDLELRLGQTPPYPPADYQTSATAPVWSQSLR